MHLEDAIARTDFRVPRGRTLELLLTVEDYPVDADFTDASYVFTLKVTPTEADPGALQKRTGSGISFLDDTRRSILIQVPPAELTSIPLERPLPYDVVLILSEDQKHTVQTGFFTFAQEITSNP